jgi:hypothetical protein
MTHYRSHPRWYAVALLTTPALLVPILCVLSVVDDPVYLPRAQLHLFAIGLIAGAFEEIGWTGLATPRLLERTAFHSAGLTLGFIWAFWHVLADFTGNISTMGAQWPTVVRRLLAGDIASLSPSDDLAVRAYIQRAPRGADACRVHGLATCTEPCHDGRARVALARHLRCSALGHRPRRLRLFAAASLDPSEMRQLPRATLIG